MSEDGFMTLVSGSPAMHVADECAKRSSAIEMGNDQASQCSRAQRANDSWRSRVWGDGNRWELSFGAFLGRRHGHAGETSVFPAQVWRMPVLSTLT